MKTVLVFGKSGQLARSLAEQASAHREVRFVSRNECDLAIPEQVALFLEENTPGMIINAAAYTAVDKAEKESGLSYLVNEEAVRRMAAYSHTSGTPFLHISTDFVFDGKKESPYLPGDTTTALGEYGKSKLAGEIAALTVAPETTMIIRTSRVYSEHGNNFVKTMLRLMNEKDQLEVVNDQWGSPTYVLSLAEMIWQIENNKLFTPGIYHWTDSGNITWYEFAKAIQQEALEAGHLSKAIPINPITTEDYPTPAARPSYSVLDNGKLAGLLGKEPIPWRQNLKLMLARL